MAAKLERVFERAILDSRLFIVIAVACGIISTLVMIILGSMNVLVALSNLFDLFGNLSQLEKMEKIIVTSIISAVDAYLIATVLLIFSIGLYELFISKIEGASLLRAKILVIKNLDELKEKLAKVIIIVLIVTYFKYALEFDYTKVIDLLALGGGILLIALSIYFISKSHDDN